MKQYGFGDHAGFDLEEFGTLRMFAGLDHESAKSGYGTDDVIDLGEHGVELLEAGVKCGCAFEVEICGGGVAFGAEYLDQRASRAVEIVANAFDLAGVRLVGAALEARSVAHLH